MKINLLNLSSFQEIGDTKQNLIKALGETFESMKTDPLTAVVMCGSVIVVSALYLRSCLYSKQELQTLAIAKKDAKITELEKQWNAKGKQSKIGLKEDQKTYNAIYKLTTSDELKAYISICRKSQSAPAAEMQTKTECQGLRELVQKELIGLTKGLLVKYRLEFFMQVCGCTKEHTDAILGVWY